MFFSQRNLKESYEKRSTFQSFTNLGRDGFGFDLGDMLVKGAQEVKGPSVIFVLTFLT